MPETHSHMQADGVDHVIEMEQTEVSLSKESDSEYLRAIVTEKTSYETQLRQLKGDENSSPDRIALITEALAATTSELERISPSTTESRKTPGVRK